MKKFIVMLMNCKPKYSYNDLTIMPCEVSDIKSRSECNPYLPNNMLPLFTAPMSTVVDCDNYDLFVANKIQSILPRNIDFDIRYGECIRNNKWCAFSLREFIDNFTIENVKFNKAHVLIDIANGHMKQTFDLVKRAKSIHGDRLIIMIGNIANPKTYKHVFDCGADYVRVGIGGGRGCITSSNTSTHFPMGSLISEIFDEKLKLHRDNNGISWDAMPKIIADGGIRNYSDIIKALALGADYVMVGSVFAKMIESAAPYTFNVLHGLKISSDIIDNFTIDKVERRNGKFFYCGVEIDIEKKYYGMASKSGQNDMGCDVHKTAEGLETTLKCEYTMSGWVSNFTDYLRSAMSYCDCMDIAYFHLKANVIPITINAYNSINK